MELFKAAHHSAQPDLANLLEPTWNPGYVNGNSARPWGKSESSHVPQDPGVCWDTSGTTHPIGLQDMSAEERELFVSDVNSPLKLPQQNKDGSHPGGAGGQNGRKASVSHGSVSNYGMSSPSTASRPGTRRRETTDTNPFPASAGLTSPTATSRFSRDEASSWFGRKNADAKEPAFDEPAEENFNARDQSSRGPPFGSLSRNNTAGTSGFAASSTIWGNTGTANTGTSSSGVGNFGNFSLAAQAAAGNKQFGSGGGSRLAHLMPKDGPEGVPSKANEGANPDLNRSWRARPRTDTDPFGADSQLSGSAVLGGAQESSPPPMPPQSHRVGPFDTPVKGSAGDFGMSGLSIGGHGEGIDTASPETNPFQSPAADRGEDEHEGSMDRAHAANIGSEQNSNFSTISRAFAAANAFDGSDRSQTSSVGAKGHPALSALTSGGWPAGPSSGTPDRERPAYTSAFGNSLFSPVGEFQSPGLAGLGGIFAGPNAPAIGGSGSLRGSKLGSLFPPAMQAQMQTQDQEHLGDSIPDLRQNNPLGAIGRGPIGSQTRETDSPLRSGRGVFEDLFPSAESARLPFTTGEQGQPGLTTTTQGQPFTPTTATAGFSAGQPSTEQSGVQSRTMVMPDRMRWVYLDPQGQIQGPFTGLEMNDWYKAQFFSADLRVKKIEDHDFEPLGQLIRRIGNSREPFLVPQIGIPHGPPSQPGPFSPGDTRGVVPPLLGAFPSFGRTLTAEEQNNLERRKQEEQFMMARQREFLAHQQTFGKLQMQGAPGVSGSLQHHSSAQSLQSQPSFGSMTSPIGMPSQAPISSLGPNPGFFESSSNIGQGPAQPPMGSASDAFPHDLNLQERQILAGLPGAGSTTGGFPSQPHGAPSADANLGSQLPSADQLQNDSQGYSARLKEFHEIRALRDADEAGKSGLSGTTQEITKEKTDASAAPPTEDRVAEIIKRATRTTEIQDGNKVTTQTREQLSLTQQVQNTQAAAAAAVATKLAETEDVWNKQFTPGLPMPFPPPSSTPLPAPMAQRGRSTLPTQFNTPSPSGTPDTTSEPPQPPPLAPWAPQPGTGSQKGPSLKEIQEMEAKKAARAEEAAAAARRALLVQEATALREREKASASVASGLPSTSTWGTGSPVNVPNSGSPWAAKPTVGKTGAPGLVAGGSSSGAAHKKTLAEIQREEEARKNKAKDVTVQQPVATPPSSMGKRYADLASKTSAPPGLANHSVAPAGPAASGGAQPSLGGWATVGAGGKVKIPTGPAAQTRTASSGIVKPSTPAAAKPVSKPVSNPVAKENGDAAMEEFNKWLHRELSRGLDGIKDSKFLPSSPVSLPTSDLGRFPLCHSPTNTRSHHSRCLRIQPPRIPCRHVDPGRCRLCEQLHHGRTSLCRGVCAAQEARRQGHYREAASQGRLGRQRQERQRGLERGCQEGRQRRRRRRRRRWSQGRVGDPRRAVQGRPQP